MLYIHTLHVYIYIKFLYIVLYNNKMLLHTLFALLLLACASAHNHHHHHVHAQSLTKEAAVTQCHEYSTSMANYQTFQREGRDRALLAYALSDITNAYDPQFTFSNGVPLTKPRHGNEIAAIIGACYQFRATYWNTNLVHGSEDVLFLTPAGIAPFMANLTATVTAWQSQIDDSSSNIANGFAWGQQVYNDIWDSHTGDGFNVTGAPVIGVWPYVQDQWYPSYNSDTSFWENQDNAFAAPFAGSVYQNPATYTGASFWQWGNMQPLNLPNNMYISVPPRPAYTDPAQWIARDLLISYVYGAETNYNARLPAELDDINAMINAPAGEYCANLVQQIVATDVKILKADDPDVVALNLTDTSLYTGGSLNANQIAYLYAKVYEANQDANIHTAAWKNLYNCDRPQHKIHWGNTAPTISFAADTTWVPTGFGAPNQEYPCGHCGVSAACMEALRLASINIGLIVPGADNMPGGPYYVHTGPRVAAAAPLTGPDGPYLNTVALNTADQIYEDSFTNYKNRVVDARLPMHFKSSGITGQGAGNALAQYESVNGIVPL
jgi:hypothetical protein